MIPLAKNIKRYFSLKELAIVLAAVVVSVSVGVGVFVNLKKEVLINDNGKKISVKTMKTTVNEVLEQNGISVSPDDFINVPLGKKLQKIGKTEINIKRAVPINVQVDGQELKLMTYMDTVKQALDGSSIKLSEKDRLDEGQSVDDKIVQGMNIKVIRVVEKEMKEDTPIKFDVVNRENNHLDKGKEQVVREGKEGIREKVFKIVYEDGKQVLKQLIKDSTALAPVSKIIEYGTVLNFKTSRGDVVRYKKILDMRATAYTASYSDTGKSPGDPGFGVTYTGMRVRHGVVAVDPKKIPLGTKLYIECLGREDYGFAVAADIGGAIKGNLIDLYFEDAKTASRWGAKRVKVYILTE